MTAPTPEQLAALDRISRYGCPVCFKAYDSLAEKKAHVKREHPR